jgi:hypothetical protein
MLLLLGDKTHSVRELSLYATRKKRKEKEMIVIKGYLIYHRRRWNIGEAGRSKRFGVARR